MMPETKLVSEGLSFAFWFVFVMIVLLTALEVIL